MDRRKGIENAASFRANGTGPYRLRERQPNVKTSFVRNGNYWGKVEGNVGERGVHADRQRRHPRGGLACPGQVDVIEPVPLQDVARINASGKSKVMQGPELRTIFLGMDQKRDELLFSNIKGKNPFKDKRVRQAFYQAIDINGIQRTVMRGASKPTALMVGPGINGFDRAMNNRLPYDAEAAKKLLAEAGYPNGFEVAMNCPNDRYVNDGAHLPGGGGQPGPHRGEDQPAGRDQGHLFPQDPQAATPASTCWAGRRAPTTRTTR